MIRADSAAFPIAEDCVQRAATHVPRRLFDSQRTAPAIAVKVTSALLCVLFLGSTSLVYPFGRDQGEYAYIASAALDGRVIYTEIFNVKPPLTHLVHQLALWMFGHSMLAIRLLDIAWQAATALVLVLIADRLYKSRFVGPLAALLYGIWYYRFDYWNTAQTDGFLTLPLALGVLAFLVARERANKRVYFACGAALGIAVLFKYSIGLLIPLLGLLALRTQGRTGLRSLLTIGLGLSVPLAICAAGLAAQGALSDFLLTQLTYVPRYNVGPSGENYLTSLSWNFLHFSWHSFDFKWFIALLMLELLYVLRKHRGPQIMPIMLWWLAAVASFAVQNKFYPYHFLPILAPQALVTAHVLSVSYATLSKAYRLRIALPGLLPLGLVLAYFTLGYSAKHQSLIDIAAQRTSLASVYEGPEFGAYGKGDYSVRADLEVARYLATHSSPGDQIFIWGFEPTIYFLSQRTAASRFIYNYPLYADWTWPELREQFLAEIQRTAPLYILVVSNDAIPWVTRTEDDSHAALRKFAPFDMFIASHYGLETVIEDFTIYRRQRGSSASGAYEGQVMPGRPRNSEAL